MSKSPVDTSKLSSYQPPGVWTEIDPSVQKLLPADSEVLERILGCVYFCYELSSVGKSDQDAVEPYSLRKYLRAALAEFVSLEEAARVDMSNGTFSSAPKIIELNDPRLHVVKLLRNANIHLAASEIDKSSFPAIWAGPDGNETFTYRVFYAKDVENAIKTTRDAKRYNSNDLSKMIAWIESEQKAWGINHLILRTAELYVRELLGNAI